MKIYLDIETEALPEEEVLKYFYLENIKLGNLTDTAKIKKKIENAKIDAISGAALSPLTGSVCAVGIYLVGESTQIQTIKTTNESKEAELIELVWSIVTDEFKEYRNGKLLGWNIRGFDIPFLVRRSWSKGIPVPQAIFNEEGKLSFRIVDLMLLWSVGNWSNRFEKLDNVAKFFDLPSKPFPGKDFAYVLKEDEAAAIRYLKNDLDVCFAIDEAMKFD